MLPLLVAPAVENRSTELAAISANEPEERKRPRGHEGEVSSAWGDAAAAAGPLRPPADARDARLGVKNTAPLASPVETDEVDTHRSATNREAERDAESWDGIALQNRSS